MTSREFRALCKNYNVQKQLFGEMHQTLNTPLFRDNIERRSDIVAKRRAVEVEIGMLADNLYLCQSTFESIEKTCGESARDIMWKIYVDRTPFEEVADEMKISLSSLEKRLKGWRNSVGIN
ncbi:MAG: hypothetical protein IJI66_10440 [Erysipelotrichaceae bacterium]|nr:hypothetical protein [Erysipelotrichaceae bacterium]